MKAKNKLYFMECNVAGRQYHETDEVWDKLKVGTELFLERDLQNRYDTEAVAIIFRNPEDGEEYILGYVPRTVNKTLAVLLEMGHTDIFECRISKINPEVHYEDQLHVCIKIKRRVVKELPSETKLISCAAETVPDVTEQEALTSE